jgi:hypothetical protein
LACLLVLPAVVVVNAQQITGNQRYVSVEFDALKKAAKALPTLT